MRRVFFILVVLLFSFNNIVSQTKDNNSLRESKFKSEMDVDIIMWKWYILDI